jgi:hypothetical protein
MRKKPDDWLARRLPSFSLSAALEDTSSDRPDDGWRPNWFAVAMVALLGLAVLSFWAFAFAR